MLCLGYVASTAVDKWIKAWKIWKTITSHNHNKYPFVHPEAVESRDQEGSNLWKHDHTHLCSAHGRSFIGYYVKSLVLRNQIKLMNFHSVFMCELW